MDRILPFFDPPPTWTVLYPKRGQTQTFFDPLPPHLVHVVVECPLIRYNMDLSGIHLAVSAERNN